MPSGNIYCQDFLSAKMKINKDVIFPSLERDAYIFELSRYSVLFYFVLFGSIIGVPIFLVKRENGQGNYWCHLIISLDKVKLIELLSNK